MVNINRKYCLDEAVVIPGDITPEGLLSHSTAGSLKFILNRMGYELPDNIPKDAMVATFLDEFTENREWIVRMIPMNVLEFLVETWEDELIFIDEERWEYLDFLRIFGLAAGKKGNPISNEPNMVYVIDEMRDAFYFYLKSPRTVDRMSRYDEWEKVFVGLMLIYGIMDVRKLYKIFCKVMNEAILYDKFENYIMCRSLIWGMYTFLEDNKGNRYIRSLTVENPEFQLVYRDEHPDLPYKCPGKEELIMLCDNGGIDNTWRGLSELVQTFYDDLSMNYYQVTMTVNTIVAQISNGKELEDVIRTLDTIHNAEDEISLRMTQAVSRMYMAVPVYEYKGYSRSEFQRKNVQLERKRRKEQFGLVRGGKDFH